LKQTARDVRRELVLDELRQRRCEALLDRRVEREQVFAHHLVQRAFFRTAPRVRRLDGHGARLRNLRAGAACERFRLDRGGGMVAAPFPPAAAGPRRC
jgi:hypothetical protein